jgi:mannose-1-phosphate guanylyltransferase/mannose-6-phosphate isomerase
MLPMTEDLSSHRMVTVTTGSGLLETGAITRPLRIGDNFEVPAGETASIYCGPETEMQLVEVVCEVVAEATEAVATLQLVHS